MMNIDSRSRARLPIPRVPDPLGRFLALIAIAVLGGVLLVAGTKPANAQAARANSFPTHPVKILVGQSAGGGTDVLARLIGEKLSTIWGQPVIVENRPGASGSIAMNAVARAPADGHTLGMLILNHVVYEPLAANPPYRIARDLAPIIWLSRQSNILVVTPSVPANNVTELIAYLKSNPGKISYASGGAGSPAHVAAELFKLQTGVDMVHVPYKGAAPAMQDLIGGTVSVMFAAAPVSLPLVRSGKLRALGVTSDTRSAQTPELPSLAESGLKFDVRDWQGIVAASGVPQEIIKIINTDVQHVLDMPEIKQKIASLGGEVTGGDSARFAEHLRLEAQKWERVVNEAKLKNE